VFVRFEASGRSASFLLPFGEGCRHRTGAQVGVVRSTELWNTRAHTPPGGIWNSWQGRALDLGHASDYRSGAAYSVFEIWTSRGVISICFGVDSCLVILISTLSIPYEKKKLSTARVAMGSVIPGSCNHSLTHQESG
jgi:hypothetical protein